MSRYCIIGAGPSGLAAARALSEARISFDVFERHNDVGGIWDIDNPNTPIYESAHFISSRSQSAFDGFPMPADYPDYPSWKQILDYIRAFADQYDLRKNIRFDTTVAKAQPDANGWTVTLGGGEVLRYDGVIAAVGHDWDPVRPEYPGSFDGASYHTVSYRSAAELAGKRVLVVGAGNSGCDIACDAATQAKESWISMRRGYWFLPKHVFGQPTDEFFHHGPQIPNWLAPSLLAVLLRVLVGDLRRLGLQKPDHKPLATHPIMNTQLLHHLAHGDIAAKPDIAELRGRTVRFTDGSEIEPDLILWATGYRPRLPFLEAGGVHLAEDGEDLYLNIFSREHPGLYVMGFFGTAGAAYPIVSKQGALVAAVIAAKEKKNAGALRAFDELRSKPRSLLGGMRYLRSPRHAFYVQFETYLKELDRVLASVSDRLTHRR
ncbi:MAG: NAD(P)-binding domain-containing protein [Gemmatimonadaceae bacterium]